MCLVVYNTELSPCLNTISIIVLYRNASNKTAKSHAINRRTKNDDKLLKFNTSEKPNL